MKWGTTEDNRLIVEIVTLSNTEQEQIGSQIEKAVKLWQKVATRIVSIVHIDIEECFLVGKVPPIFPTLNS